MTAMNQAKIREHSILRIANLIMKEGDDKGTLVRFFQSLKKIVDFKRNELDKVHGDMISKTSHSNPDPLNPGRRIVVKKMETHLNNKELQKSIYNLEGVLIQWEKILDEPAKLQKEKTQREYWGSLKRHAAAVKNHFQVFLEKNWGDSILFNVRTANNIIQDFAKVIKLIDTKNKSGIFSEKSKTYTAKQWADLLYPEIKKLQEFTKENKKVDANHFSKFKEILQNLKQKSNHVINERSGAVSGAHFYTLVGEEMADLIRTCDESINYELNLILGIEDALNTYNARFNKVKDEQGQFILMIDEFKTHFQIG
ncbi:MAG: hypothetical protein ACMXYF_01355 [Candidatus Woesearchaeota archaeon]